MAKNENVTILRQLIAEGGILKNKSPKLGEVVSFKDGTIQENEISCHKWCVKTYNFLANVFGDKSRQAIAFKANFKNEYHFTNFLGMDGATIRYFYDNIGKAVTELEVIAEDITIQVEKANQFTVSTAFDLFHFHPKVIEVSKKLFDDGHYSSAILNAYIALNEAVKNKSGMLDKDGFDLMNTVFNEERPILKFNELKTVSDKDEQRGFRFIFAGSMAGIRNPKAHMIIIQRDPYRTLEYLALASILFKRIDELHE